MTADHEHRAGQTPFQRLENYHSSRFHSTEGSDIDYRELTLEDETLLALSIDKSDEQPDHAFHISVITAQERRKPFNNTDYPNFFGFIISQSGKHDSLIIPKLRLIVGDTTLHSSLGLDTFSIPFADPVVSETLTGWFDKMIEENRHLPPPVSLTFPEELIEPKT